MAGFWRIISGLFRDFPRTPTGVGARAFLLNCRPRLFGTTIALLIGLWAAPALSADIHVAVAANFKPALVQLLPLFQRQSGHQVMVSSGSTGKLYTQILHGAPHDLFLSADGDHPARLVTTGRADGASRTVYAIGRLALWDPHGDPHTPLPQRLMQAQRLAMANPATAPYGAAARHTLLKLGLWEVMRPHLITGESVAQAFLFVNSGNVDMGLVALSQLQQHQVPQNHYRLIHPGLHPPILQEAVLLKPVREPARELLDFLTSAPTRQQLKKMGYETP